MIIHYFWCLNFSHVKHIKKLKVKKKVKSHDNSDSYLNCVVGFFFNVLYKYDL